MSTSMIHIKHARVHNLKNISVDIPKNKLTVITGLSGSGKSSLAFDTIYAEGQRRYAESLSAYARQFMDIQDKPDVDEIKGLSPTIAIDQKNTSQNPRSTVGTSTEIYDNLRLLFARLGTQYDPETNEALKQQSAGEIIEDLRRCIKEDASLLLIAPMQVEEPIKSKSLLNLLAQTGLEALRINGVEMHIKALKKYRFDNKKSYEIELVIGRIDAENEHDLAHFVDLALDYGQNRFIVIDEESGEESPYSTVPYAHERGTIFDPIEARSFSFNSPYGACPRCTGLGYTMDVSPNLLIPNERLTLAEGAIQPWTRIVGNQRQYQAMLAALAEAQGFSVDVPVEDLSQEHKQQILYGTGEQRYDVKGKSIVFEGVIPNLQTRHRETDSEYIRKEIEQYMEERICPDCDGKRLKKNSLFVRIGQWSIADIVEQSIQEALPLFQSTDTTEALLLAELSAQEKMIAKPLCDDIALRIQNMINVGLAYLTLNRSVNTLAGGEAQRIRLSTQLSTGLTDVIYILDEPSIGLHPRDNKKLIRTLESLRDIGNTVIVVEHDQEMMEAADYIIDIGPGAGMHGGEIMAQGDADAIRKNDASLTGRYMAGKESITTPKKYRKAKKARLEIINASAFNLKNVDVSIPLGLFVCVTGVSGSGKSTLIIDVLSKALSKHFYRSKAIPGTHKEIKGLKHIDKVIAINQTPIGRTPRSNPATYTGLFTPIRDLFANQPEAKVQGLSAGMFSFNVKGGGRCEACSGDGYKRIPMQFLSDVFVECSECSGQRYNKTALSVHYRGKNIADVLNMTVEEALQFFSDLPMIASKLGILRDVGLSYLRLGQSATTLSGGEAQRIKLATELSRRSTGKTLYILDEPTTGLHFEDIKKLLHVLNKLVDKGNTVLTIEHNLDIIKSADWIIDMGPDGGSGGGQVVATGTPKDIMTIKKSLTGQYLKEIL